ncbi:hypothetical protein TTHERM_00016430 (macronuclear) [Tetrahymena thermophila SB210]|uniref:Uncharacterized protein n=1 Tax=Tetrahymena thermophila (strain SB210) TaxID=312017 RepID=Q22RE5_TETTS|nr:hypothetical protein TTHERM_00016430 [Tetrahymena thermophila SB210]EAR88177.2 hypothetical protein TTHERM_00016430 [Tetrahymena thermophila SB210]|eukprot:XP_001008422.2 hypothetical protein TTHERM_00016430 [Tetrahymena thermophila SB210]
MYLLINLSIHIQKMKRQTKLLQTRKKENFDNFFQFDKLIKFRKEDKRGKQTNKQTKNQINKLIYKQINKQTHKQAYKQTIQIHNQVNQSQINQYQSTHQKEERKKESDQAAEIKSQKNHKPEEKEKILKKIQIFCIKSSAVRQCLELILTIKLKKKPS